MTIVFVKSLKPQNTSSLAEIVLMLSPLQIISTFLTITMISLFVFIGIGVNVSMMYIVISCMIHFVFFCKICNLHSIAKYGK